jgi:Fe-S cluster biogenesis protein NfuA
MSPAGDAETSDVVHRVVTDFGALVAADGARVDVRSITSEALVLDLVLVEAGCAECVMPRAHLEAILRDQLQDALTRPPTVAIHDPREIPG